MNNMSLYDAIIASKMAATIEGTDNYNQLSNQPKINNVTLAGNKTSSDLGLQSTIDSSHKLDSANVSFSAAQSSALSSGIDSTKVSQISTIIELEGRRNVLDMSKCESFTDESLTVTANNDGSFTIDGTTASGTPIYSNAYTGERSITTADQLDNVKHLKNGTYQYVGDSSIVVQIIEYNDASDRDIRYNSSNDGTFTITGEKSYNYVRLYTNGTTYDNKTITFMICPSNIYNADPKLEPYAMTNAELTAAIRTIQAQLAE